MTRRLGSEGRSWNIINGSTVPSNYDSRTYIYLPWCFSIDFGYFDLTATQVSPLRFRTLIPHVVCEIFSSTFQVKKMYMYINFTLNIFCSSKSCLYFLFQFKVVWDVEKNIFLERGGIMYERNQDGKVTRSHINFKYGISIYDLD